MKELRKGMLLVISGPSGAGKGTLLNMLLEEDKSFAFSVSVTTRKPRPGEENHVHYHFISDEEYDKLLEQDAFVEHADVHGNRYGTLKDEVYQRMEQGQNVLLDIDTQGALEVINKMPECVSVFVLPPSMEELRSRLVGRGTEKPEDVERRMGNAMGEINLMNHYQYAIVNDDVHAAYAKLLTIVKAEKQRTNRYTPVME